MEFYKDDIQMHHILHNMEQRGGAFVKKLAGLYRSADYMNKLTLVFAFKKYFEDYKPKKNV